MNPSVGRARTDYQPFASFHLVIPWILNSKEHYLKHDLPFLSLHSIQFDRSSAEQPAQKSGNVACMIRTAFKPYGIFPRLFVCPTT